MASPKLVRTVALSLACFVSIGVAEAGTLGPSRETSEVKRLIKSANQHNLKNTMSLFTSSPTIRIGKRVFKGRSAVESWWKTEFHHGLKASFRSELRVKGSQTNAVISRTTQGGDCSKKCLEAARWRFAGGKVGSMTLTKLKTPATKVPKRPKTVPTPPKGTPPANVTPTIPS
jgi:hypothetical protein